MKGHYKFALGVLAGFLIKHPLGEIKPKIPGGQLWVYKHEENPQSLLYIFAGSARYHNWNLVDKLIREAVQRRDPDWKLFNPNIYVIKDYPD